MGVSDGRAGNLVEAFAAGIASGAVEVVDLTHALTPDFPVIVLPPELGQCRPFRIEEVSRYDERGPAWYWNDISMSEHAGTHFDAPAHWVSGRHLPANTVDAVPPADLIGPACVIDMSERAAADPDALLTREDIEAWESGHGAIPSRAWVLLRTGWGAKVGTDEYLNLREDGAHSPGPHPVAMRFLVEERDVLGFGTETVGTDAGQASHLDPPYPAHHFLHGAGRYGLQCLAHLDRLPPTGALLIASPLKIGGGSGSPCRVLAFLGRDA